MASLRVALASVFAMQATPLLACERDPFLFLLPGESVAQAESRSKQIRSDFDTVRKYNRQKYAFENSTAIYLGRVVSAEDIQWQKLPWKVPSTTVKPIVSFKGALPGTNQQLIDEAQSGTCTDYGDGQGAWTKKGEFVVVFLGLKTSEERPNGIDSFRPSDIRIVELLDAIARIRKEPGR